MLLNVRSFISPDATSDSFILMIGDPAPRESVAEDRILTEKTFFCLSPAPQVFFNAVAPLPLAAGPVQAAVAPIRNVRAVSLLPPPTVRWAEAVVFLVSSHVY